MLGADERYLKKEWGFRNHYCASSCSENEDLKHLIIMDKAGLVTSGKRMDHTTFWATKEGALFIGFNKSQLVRAELY